MSKSTVHQQFLNFLLENTPKLKKKRIKFIGNGERRPHIRFSTECGLESPEEFTELFESLNLPFETISTADFSKTYKLGGYVQWNGNSVGVLYGVEKNGKSERKKFAPDSLNLAGYETSNPTDFRNKIIEGLLRVEKDDGFRDCLISMLDNVEGKGQICDHPFLKPNINRIKSDFGEVLAAYNLCLNGVDIKFPVSSNNPGIDFWGNGHPYSVKAPNGGGKVNLKPYKDFIPQTSTAGKFLYSIATYNRDDFFKYAAMLSPEVQILADWVGGTTREDIKHYIRACSYDEHYAKMREDGRFDVNNHTLGIPDIHDNKPEELTPKELWANGSLEPFDFTLNTIINRFWGEKDTDTITDIVSKFLNNATFIHIDIQNLNVIAKETPFENVSTWKTVYWSRSTRAWHNWMNVEPIKEQK